MAGTGATGEAGTPKAERGASGSGCTGFPVIVLDASTVVELLTNGMLAESLRRHLGRRNDSFIVPHLLDVERGRMWELRHNFTVCDAAYIALAEITGSVLYTCDEKLG